MRKPFDGQSDEPKLILIPLVDVLLAVFLFLAILAFKTPYVSVFVQLPKGEGTEANLKTLNLVIDKSGNLLVGGKVIKPSQLAEVLKEKKTSVANVMADRDTPYRYVAEVLSTLQRLGITDVNLILKRR